MTVGHLSRRHLEYPAHEADELVHIEVPVVVLVHLPEQGRVVLPARLVVVRRAEHAVPQALDLIGVEARSYDALRQAPTACVWSRIWSRAIMLRLRLRLRLLLRPILRRLGLWQRRCTYGAMRGGSDNP